MSLIPGANDYVRGVLMEERRGDDVVNDSKLFALAC